MLWAARTDLRSRGVLGPRPPHEQDYVTALDEFVGALEVDPTNAEAHSQLG